MYTYNEAVKIFKYYSDKVIGKKIDEKKAKDLLVTHMKIEDLGNNKFDVYCYTKANISIHFYRNIASVANDLDLLSPSDVLEE
ncbi:hypothetical protein P0R33_00350 [Flavobacterium sp. YJ01]|uniref:hypothetical protein n=1 Tax=Flavobacterium sp. YJ01 TaxID=3031997 RepID=UPI0023E3E4E2|nr:hypothetical protein [Flavobacterium sp. YJ01]WET02787.1 hypothetical protein P0R33_00350 [Flavobacterium sp. YJ01]